MRLDTGSLLLCLTSGELQEHGNEVEALSLSSSSRQESNAKCLRRADRLSAAIISFTSLQFGHHHNLSTFRLSWATSGATIKESDSSTLDSTIVLPYEQHDDFDKPTLAASPATVQAPGTRHTTLEKKDGCGPKDHHRTVLCMSQPHSPFPKFPASNKVAGPCHRLPPRHPLLRPLPELSHTPCGSNIRYRSPAELDMWKMCKSR